jgi:5'-3' exoribonuclease 2
MGVPSFFRWLSQKYPKIIADVLEDEPSEVNGTQVPVDFSGVNPNGIEFDCLYLDMNGIIHPCSHPEDRPAPTSEEEIMIAIFSYIDRLFGIVRPRKLLYMAIDGVAPRAKMNQQRSRRFRAAQDAKEKEQREEEIRKELGEQAPPKSDKARFDSNCITPGTAFMQKVSDCLSVYVAERVKNDPGWRNIRVVLSDASVPGEGEHKLMEFIRRQRTLPEYDANLKHVVYGLDADLIMLTLATHEPHFSILREMVTFNTPPCPICGQTGHNMQQCQGKPREKSEENIPAPKKPYQFLHINVLREYLERDLKPDQGLPFEWQFERAVDDFVFMCFFVGNDFLPHLPSLEIREGAIEMLMTIYVDLLPTLDGYMTENGNVFLDRARQFVNRIGDREDEILRRRFQKQQAQKARFQREKDREKNDLRRKELQEINGVLRRAGAGPLPPGSNEEAAAVLRNALLSADAHRRSGSKEPLKLSISVGNEEEYPDEVRLGDEGWKLRYYKHKFGINEYDAESRKKLITEMVTKYVEGLCWVLRYYYQGCCSWRWFYPFHYAPFSMDIADVDLGKLDIKFDLGMPFKPIEQLLCVLPAGSMQFLPLPCRKLMTDEDSILLEYYPESFQIDMDGKRFAWQGVALLPFIDEKIFQQAMDGIERYFTPEERERNRFGDDVLVLSAHTPLGQNLLPLVSVPNEPVPLPVALSPGILGTVMRPERWREPKLSVVITDFLRSDNFFTPALLRLYYRNPPVPPGFVFLARMLPSAKPPPFVLDDRDMQKERPRDMRLGEAAQRHIQGGMGPGGRSHDHGRFQPYQQQGGQNYRPGGPPGYYQPGPPRQYDQGRDRYDNQGGRYENQYRGPPRYEDDRRDGRQRDDRAERGPHHYGQRHNPYGRPDHPPRPEHRGPPPAPGLLPTPPHFAPPPFPGAPAPFLPPVPSPQAGGYPPPSQQPPIFASPPAPFAAAPPAAQAAQFLSQFVPPNQLQSLLSQVVQPPPQIPPQMPPQQMPPQAQRPRDPRMRN